MSHSRQIVESSTITTQKKPVRLSDLRGLFQTVPSRKGLKKAIDKGLVLLNGKRAHTGDWVAGGEIIALLREQPNGRVLEIPLDVIFEDEYLAVVNKPGGIVVSGNKHRTLENALPVNLKPSGQLDALVRPQAIHRLDFPTSGLLLVGKTRKIVALLNRQFEGRKVLKGYAAITVGEMPECGEVVIPVDGKHAHTVFQRVSRIESSEYGALNLVNMRLLTGRRHQLRKHMAALGNPILHDGLYGLKRTGRGGNGLFLCACSLSFEHPINGEQINLKCELPEKFRRIAF